MPALCLIVASGTGQRRLLEETISKYEKKGFVPGSKQEGGDWASLLSENMSSGLFNEKKLTMVESAELLGPMPKHLASMVESESSVVIVLAYKDDPAKLFPKELIKRCAVLKPAEFPKWPRERRMWVSALAEEMKINIALDAVALIVEMLDDPEEIRSQLTVLASLRRGELITANDVETLCLDDGNRNLLRFLDGLCTGDHKTALKSLRAVSLHSQLIPTVAAIYNRFRLGWYVAAYPDCAAIFAKALGTRDYARRQGTKAALKYGSKALGRFISGLIALNASEKSGLGSGWASLEILVNDLLSSACQRQ